MRTFAYALVIAGLSAPAIAEKYDCEELALNPCACEFASRVMAAAKADNVWIRGTQAEYHGKDWRALVIFDCDEQRSNAHSISAFFHLDEEGNQVCRIGAVRDQACFEDEAEAEFGPYDDREFSAEKQDIRDILKATSDTSP